MNGWDEGNPKWSIKNQIIHFYKLSAFSNNFYKIPEKSRQIWQMARSNIRLPIWCWLYPEIGETNPCPMSNYRWVKISSIHIFLYFAQFGFVHRSRYTLFDRDSKAFYVFLVFIVVRYRQRKAPRPPPVK